MSLANDRRTLWFLNLSTRTIINIKSLANVHVTLVGEVHHTRLKVFNAPSAVMHSRLTIPHENRLKRISETPTVSIRFVNIVRLQMDGMRPVQKTPEE